MDTKVTEASPIAAFAFNRPKHLASTLAALARNDYAASSDLTVFCDGPRSDEDVGPVQEVRAVAHGAQGFRSVRVVERPRNLGLARSIITGVSEMLEASETVIVVEDDLTTSPHFLRFMNDGLRQYADEDRVVSISGYCHPIGGDLPETYFLRGAYCWGWATWRRGWALFEHDPHRCLAELDRLDLIWDFDVQGSIPYTQFLLRAAMGKGDSWALRWMASATVHDKLTLYPGQSLVRNDGNDNSGTHAGSDNVFDTDLSDRPIRVAATAIEEDEGALARHRRFNENARIRWSRQRVLFHRVAKLMPAVVERKLYMALVRRSLRRSGVS